MSEHPEGFSPRRWTNDELRKMSVSHLYGMAAECDVDPAEVTKCDACAAYVIAQNKEAGHSELHLAYTIDDDGIWLECGQCAFRQNLGHSPDPQDALDLAVKHTQDTGQ